MIDWLIDWLNNWFIKWLIYWMNSWFIYVFIYFLKHQISKNGEDKKIKVHQIYNKRYINLYLKKQDNPDTHGRPMRPIIIQWLVDLLIDWMIYWRTDWFILIAWLTLAWHVVGIGLSMTHVLNQSIDWLIEWLIDW